MVISGHPISIGLRRRIVDMVGGSEIARDPRFTLLHKSRTKDGETLIALFLMISEAHAPRLA